MTSAVPDAQTVSRIIRDTAAGEIMPRFRHLAAGDVREKTGGEVVTTADLAAEARLAEDLTRLVPGSAVVGEEGAAADPGVVDALAGDGPVWVLDPVDGTQNFADGTPCFAVIVGYRLGGRTVAGWIHDPIEDVTVWAVAGQGAWSAGRRLRVPGTTRLGAMRGTTGPNLRRRLEARRAAGADGVPAPVPRYGCAGREYMDLALGRLHFALFVGRLKPWDHAAGVLVHAEAGGHSALLDGAAPYGAYPEPTGATLLLAHDEAAWAALHSVIGPG